MAVTARFIADFTSFYDAVRKADAQLIDLSQRAGGAEKALNRMVDNFSGRRLVQDAQLMAEAVERVGGTSRLTQQELQRVGAQAAEAAAKLRAMGRDVPPEIQKIVDQTKHLTTQQSAMIGSLKNVAAAFGIAFSAQQLVGFVRKVFDSASAIKDMATTLGISTDAAQEFAFAAQQTGTNMGVVERAIFHVNDALATGKASFRGALKDAGLELNALRALKPEDSFRAMAEAIRLLPPEFDKTRVASELFGERLAKELMPAILEGFVEIGKQAPKMADDTIVALERAQDAWEKLGAAVVTHSGNLIAALSQLPAIAKDVASSSQNIALFLENMRKGGFGVAVGLAGVAQSAKAADVALTPMAKTVGKTAEELKEAEESAKKYAAEQKKAVEAMREFKNFVAIREMEDYAAAQKEAAKQIEENVTLEFAMNRLYRQNAKELGTYAENTALFSTGWQGFMKLAPGLVKNLTDSGKALEKGGLGKFLKEGFSGLFANKKGEGAKSIGDGFKNMLGGIGTGIFNELGSMITGGISSLVSKGIGLIGKGFGKLFGRGEKGQVDDMRQAFIDQIGGWEGLNKAAQKAGITLERVLNARTVKEYEAAIDELTEKLEFQESAMATLRETAEKYGFTLEELGPKFAAAELDEKAQELFKDFKVLTSAGIDMDVVLGKMAGSISKFVQDSVAMGIAVPNAMRPMIERMIELGLLTDANGELVGSLEESGIQFALTMSEGFAALIDEVKRLADAIRIGLGLALDDVATQIVNMPDVQIGGQVNLPDFSPDVPGFATGTGGRYLDFGKGTLAMLHGRERIMTEGEGGGGVVVNVYGSVSTERDLVDAIRRGLNDTAGRRMRAA